MGEDAGMGTHTVRHTGLARGERVEIVEHDLTYFCRVTVQEQHRSSGQSEA